MFEKNLQFVLNVTNSLPNLGRPKNFDNDPSHYQIKRTQDIQPNYFDVSYGGKQVVEATIRKELGDADITVSVVGQSGTRTIPMTAAPRGRALRRGQGLLLRAPSGDHPGARSAPAPLQRRRHRQRGREGRRPAAGVPLPDRPARLPVGQPAKKRVLVVAAEDYTGMSPNVTPGYDTAPRYLASTSPRSRPPATRSRRSTSTPRRPTAARRTRSRGRRSSTRPTSA